MSDFSAYDKWLEKQFKNVVVSFDNVCGLSVRDLLKILRRKKNIDGFLKVKVSGDLVSLVIETKKDDLK